MKKYIRASEISEKLFGLKLPKPSHKDELTRIDRMNMGTFYEKQIIDYISSKLNMKTYYKINKKNIEKYAFSIGENDYYIIGRADGLIYASYTDGVNIYRYEYVLEVKNMISYSIKDFNETIPDYYIYQVQAYSYLYNLPVLFVAQCYDGYIFDKISKEDDKIKQLISNIRDKIIERYTS